MSSLWARLVFRVIACGPWARCAFHGGHVCYTFLYVDATFVRSGSFTWLHAASHGIHVYHPFFPFFFSLRYHSWLLYSPLTHRPYAVWQQAASRSIYVYRQSPRMSRQSLDSHLHPQQQRLSAFASSNSCRQQRKSCWKSLSRSPAAFHISRSVHPFDTRPSTFDGIHDFVRYCCIPPRFYTSRCYSTTTCAYLVAS